MTTVRYVRDSEFTGPWIQLIGKFILNFGLLEFESHLWLLQMSDKPKLFADMWFTQRVTRIRHLIDKRAFDEEWKASAARSWEKAVKLAETRNRLAHNPLLFSWGDSAEVGPPDLIGVFDVRGLSGGGMAETPWSPLADISEKANEIATLCEGLSALRGTWCSLRDRKLGG